MPYTITLIRKMAVCKNYLLISFFWDGEIFASKSFLINKMKVVSIEQTLRYCFISPERGEY